MEASFIPVCRELAIPARGSRPDVPLGFSLEDALSSPRSTVESPEDNAPSRSSRFDRGFRAPPADESFGKYMGSYGTIPRSDAQLVAVEVLTFRLRGAAGRKSRAQKTQTKRRAALKQTGSVTLVASLYANGVVYLHEPTGEELLVYDTGHGRAGCPSGAAPGESPSAPKPPAAPELGDPVVTALSAEASDVDPLLLTTGTDGTVRVHALTILINGRRVAGRLDPSRRKQSKSKPDGDSTKEGGKSKKGSGDQKQGMAESSGDEEGKEDGVPGEEVSDEHAQGMEVKAQFRLCLGPACATTPAGGCEAGSGPAPAPANVELERRLTSADSPEKAITSTAAFFHRGMDTAVVVAGYTTGGIGFIHAVNGTELGSAGGTSAVRAIVRGGQYIAYTDGQDVRFASSTKLESIPDRVCRGGWGMANGQSSGPGSTVTASTVTALAFDAVATSVLYVGYGAGEVMVFNNRVQEVDGSFRCLPGYDLPHLRGDGGAGAGAGVADNDVGCNALSTVRGYLLVSRGPTLTVYNTTDDIELLFVSSGTDSAPAAASAAVDRTAEGNNCSSSSIARRWAALPSMNHGDPLLVEAAACSPGLAVYKAYFPFERSTSDMSWVRGPIILLGVLVVAITKVYTGRRDGSATSRGLRARGRGRWGAQDDDDDNDDDDLGLSSNSRDLGNLREKVYHQRTAERGVSFRRGDRETRRRGAQRYDDLRNRNDDDTD